MSNYNSNLQSKNIALQAILDKINNLPESDSEIVLPELTNEGSASDLLFGKQLIDGDGNVVTGTIPIQAAKTITPSTSSQTAVASGRYTTGTVTVAAIPSNYEDVATETTEYTSLNDELEDVINSLPAAGGSGGGSVDTCTVKITCSTSDIYGYFYTKVVDGNYSMGYLTNETSQSALDVTLTDVLCGGFISVQTGIDIGFLSVTISGDATYELIYMTSSVLPIVAITAPTSPGSYSEVTIINND